MAIWQWAKTPASNSTADPTINWTEGQPPSTLNDNDRIMMARIAEWRDDKSGVLADTGTASAYTVATNEIVQTPTPTNGTLISFQPAHTNSAGVTLAVDGGTAFPINGPAGTAIPVSTMLAGIPYDVMFTTSGNQWVLKGVTGSAFGTVTGYTITGQGIGGTVTQAGSISTAVTLNKLCGQITTVSQSWTGTPANFIVNNSLVAATDAVLTVPQGPQPGTGGFTITAYSIQSGSFAIFIEPLFAQTNAAIINFAVIKVVTT